MSELEAITSCPEETIELGRKIGSQLQGGEIIGLIGPLGSGKTCIIKGIAAGAGAKNAGQVNSPTFVIINEYAGSAVDIFHIDAYRLKSIGEFEMLGFDDYCYPRSVVLIEWADKIEAALADIDFIRLRLSHLSLSQRKIQIENMPGYISV